MNRGTQNTTLKTATRDTTQGFTVIEVLQTVTGCNSDMVMQSALMKCGLHNSNRRTTGSITNQHYRFHSIIAGPSRLKFNKYLLKTSDAFQIMF